MSKKLNILFATVYGNAENVANNINKIAIENSFVSQVNELNDVDATMLQELENVIIVSSTTGEGEIPENGEDFWNLLDSNPELNHINYGVIALGDKSHDNFCNAGKLIDEKMLALKAKQISPRLECDGDTAGSDAWAESFIDMIK